jgi:hypothetical protein
MEEVLEGVLIDPEPGIKYLVTDRTVRGGESLKQSLGQPRAPLMAHVLRWRAAGKTG